MDALAQWLLSTGLNKFVMGTPWFWPTAEIFHFIGLSLLLGAILIVDLRLAGFFRSISIATTHKLIPVAIAGFAINLITGVLFIFGDPERYFSNIGFRIKVILILIAGINALVFYWKINPKMHTWGPSEKPPVFARVVAFVSIGVWIGVLLFGRLIPYVGTG